MLPLAAALDSRRSAARLVVTQPPRLQIPQGRSGGPVAGGDEGQLCGELGDSEQRRGGRLGDGKRRRGAAVRNSAAGRVRSPVALQVGEGGRPRRGGGRRGGRSLLSFAQRGQVSVPGAERVDSFPSI